MKIESRRLLLYPISDEEMTILIENENNSDMKQAYSEMLPYGIQWHYEHFRNTILGGGYAYGCFDGNQLVGFATVNADIFGEKHKYVLLDQLFISNSRRNQGIGKNLFQMCKQAAKDLGAEKLYLCAWSAEDSMAFYTKSGCTNALEINKELYAEDCNNIQLEADLDD